MLKEIEISEVEKEIIENVLSYQKALDKLFSQLAKEGRTAWMKEKSMWTKFEGQAVKTIPDYDKKKHVLAWNFETRKLFVIEREDKNWID